MKCRKLIFAVALSAVCSNAEAQSYWGSTSTPTNTTGDCLIGNNLAVQGGLIDMSMPGTPTPTEPWRSLNVHSLFSGLYLCTGLSTSDGTYIQMHAPNEVSDPGGMSLVSNSPGGNGSGFSFNHHDYSLPPTTPDNKLMHLDNVGRLDVNGGLINLNTSSLPPYADAFRSINCGSNVGGLYLCTGTSTSDGTYMQMHAPNEPVDPGGVSIVSNSPGSNGTGFSFNHHDFSLPPTTPDNKLMHLDNVGRLDVNGGLINLNTSSLPPYADVFRSINCGSVTGGLYLCTNTNTTNSSYIQLHATSEPSNQGAIDIVSNGNGTGLGISFSSFSGTATNCNMRIYNNGKVAIGADIIAAGNVATPNWYNLYVSKGILTEKLKVANSGDMNWSDFVFSQDYRLMPLVEVESYVNRNKHLPEIPSAKEVATEGIDVAAMDAKLLQKIEELTLYVIQQQKEIEALKKKQN